MKLTVDCISTGTLFSLPKSSALAYLLSKANVSFVDLPLEAMLCEQHHLMSAPDYPIAAIAAASDGLDLGEAYWLRADPVHLVLQRDSFCLSEPCPLLVSREHAQAIMLSLNQHFKQDGLTFCLGNSGAWYVHLAKTPEIKTILPAIAQGRNIAHFMPQGAEASRWIAYLNEVQMLLHGHAANESREQMGETPVNSVWFSGGGLMPAALTTQPTVAVDLMVGHDVFYRALAERVGVPYRKASASLLETITSLLAQSSARLQLTPAQSSDDATFQLLIDALKSRKISRLVMHLSCDEKTLVAEIKPIDFYKFWRKAKSMSEYLV